jgi:hypothetical protein
MLFGVQKLDGVYLSGSQVPVASSQEQLPQQYPFGSDELRFYHRLYPFHKLSQPAPLYYAYYLESTNFPSITVWYWIPELLLNHLITREHSFSKVVWTVSSKAKLLLKEFYNFTLFHSNCHSSRCIINCTWQSGVHWQRYPRWPLFVQRAHLAF